MIWLNCVVCQVPLVKELVRVDMATGAVLTKQVDATDMREDDDPQVQITDLWCPQCGLRYHRG